jgi:hypothetical protein
LTSSSSYVGSAPGKPGLAYTESVGGYDAAGSPTSTTLSIPTGAPAFAGTSYTTSYAYYPDEQIGARKDPAEGGLAMQPLNPGGEVGVAACGVECDGVGPDLTSSS